jgi:hypothetical protein
MTAGVAAPFEIADRLTLFGHEGVSVAKQSP